MNPIATIAASEMTPAQSAAISALPRLVWPPQGEPPAPETISARWRAQATTHFVMWGEKPNQIRAHAMLFRREIFTQSGPLTVGALAAVCVHPDFRGRNWGADVVRAAFNFLPELGASVSLFQTPIPVFYQKLGCRIVHNAFFDGTRADGSKTNPFWESDTMIFPADFIWPDGEIDLNGPGY